MSGFPDFETPSLKLSPTRCLSFFSSFSDTNVLDHSISDATVCLAGPEGFCHPNRRSGVDSCLSSGVPEKLST